VTAPPTMDFVTLTNTACSGFPFKIKYITMILDNPSLRKGSGNSRIIKLSKIWIVQAVAVRKAKVSGEDKANLFFTLRVEIILVGIKVQEFLNDRIFTGIQTFQIAIVKLSSLFQK